MHRHAQRESPLRSAELTSVTQTLFDEMLMYIHNHIIVDAMRIELNIAEIRKCRYDLIIVGHSINSLEHSAPTNLTIKEPKLLVQR